MVGEIYYEVVIGVSGFVDDSVSCHVFFCGLFCVVVHGGKILLLSFHEHVVNCGELCLFPLQLLLDG